MGITCRPYGQWKSILTKQKNRLEKEAKESQEKKTKKKESKGE